MMRGIDGINNQIAQFRKLYCSNHFRFNPKNTALLFTIQIKMRERDMKSRIDYNYPFTRIDQDGFATEMFKEPPPFEISFFY